MGARGVYVLPGVREEVHEERKHDVVGLWTQTLLARVELNGWSGLRPYVDVVLAGSVAPVTVLCSCSDFHMSLCPQGDGSDQVARSDNACDTLAKASECRSQGDMRIMLPMRIRTTGNTSL